MKEATLNFLGRDSGFGEKNNSAYVETEDGLILFDCGFTVFNQIKNRFDFNKYKYINIIITHLHNDHAGSLSQVILYLWFVYNKKVTVISRCENINKYLEITGTTEYAYEIKQELENLEFIKTEHVKELDSYGIKMNINNKNIVYTGDTNTLEPFLPYLENVDEFYIDVSKNGGVHLQIDEVLPALKDIENKGIKIVLMHLDNEEYIKQIYKNNN